MKNFCKYLLFILVIQNLTAIAAFALGLKPPSSPPGVVPLFQQEHPGLSQYFVDSTLFKSQFSKFRRVESVDSTQHKYEIRELLFDKDYKLPVSMDLSYYVKQRLKFDSGEMWRKTTVKDLSKEQTAGAGGIELNIPVKIRSKAFQRIFGGDRVGLRVTGNISFELAGRSENRSGSAVSSYEQRGNFSPRFKQTQQFQVEGRVGDKVSVKVDQNSEATFDFENTLRLTYTGDEDEIIQSIEAGNVSLSLPSTNYVSASSKHQGLFGLKTEMQVGHLNFVGIASLERGEKQKITKTGKADENTFRVKDYEYTKNRFFFVDSIYQEHFESGYDPKTMVWQVFDGGAFRITQLDVWVKTQVSDEQGRKGWAVIDPDQVDPNNLDSLVQIPGKREDAYFRRLEPDKDFGYDEYRGFFWLNQNVTDDDIVAVAYSTESGLTKGQLYTQLQDSAQVLLKLVKPQSNKPSYTSTWKLAMQNVYNLGAADISQEGFDVKVIYTKTGEDVDVQPKGDPKPFNYLMGLDRLDDQGNFKEGGDKKIDAKNGNIFDLVNGYLIFPSLTPFDPPAGSEFKIDPSLNAPFYDKTNRSEQQDVHSFDVKITTSSVSSTFNLGFNVLEGSEVVRLNGRELVKDKDYTIDYFGGTLQILAPEARRADANVEIEYERGSLFQLDKKTLLGGRLEYSLGDRGFVGMTALYLNKTTLDQRVRLGQEPVRNFIWDVNTSLDFKPNYITRILDKIPILETSAESRLHVEAEYAQVNPNPNTFNEEKLGEKNGVAYLDDFEGSERTTPLGIIYRGWAPASVPAYFRIPANGIEYPLPNTDDNLMYAMDANRVRMFWFNPYNQVAIKDIWPKKDVNTQTGTTTNVLELQWKNTDMSPDSAWAGIMRSTASFPDQNKTKYLELWVQGKTGQVNIDIGRISEDFYIRKNTFTFDNKRSLRNLNTEDKNLNGLLDDGEDLGLDGLKFGTADADPFDLWRPPLETTPNFLNINGMEGNGEAKGAKYPDTEDLDGNGGLNTTNEYFTYAFNLADSANPYIKGRTIKRDNDGNIVSEWRQYRIPIRNYNPEWVVGNPDSTFREIFFVRLWINDLPKDDQYHNIKIATFDFIGNEWEERGVEMAGTTTFVRDDSLFSISAYNTEENVDEIPGGPEPYHSPPDVSGVRDRITQALSKEQSLVMQIGKLNRGDQAEATKQLYEKMNLINYKKLKMFVHGDRNLPLANSTLEFYMRFGPAEGVYYEFGEKVYPHWDTRNEVDVVLDELAKTKQDQYLVGDSLGGQPIYYRSDPANAEKYFKVVGKPSLRNINFMVIGVRNVGDSPVENMEVWLDEMRVTDVERAKGTAMRLMADLTMADVANFRAQWEVVDSDFRRIEDQFGSGSTTEKQQYRMGLKLHKFFPASWGLQIPISGGYVRSKNVPKYYYNSDQLTNYKMEGLTDKFQQFFGLSKLDPVLEKNSRITETTSLGTTIQRQGGPRAPWYLRYSVDMFTLDMDWSRQHASDETSLLNDQNALSSQLQLKVPFGNDNAFKPFGWLGNGPIVRTLANQKVYYTPNSLNFSLGIRDNENTRQARLETEATNTVSTTASRKMNLNYNLFPSLAMSFNRDYQSDAYLKGYRAKELVQAIFTRFDFGVDKVMNQNFSANYNPKFVNWMTQSFKYTSGFNYNYSNVNTNEKSSNLAVSKQISVSLQPSTLAKQIYDPSRRKIPQGRQGGPPPRRGGKPRLPGQQGGDQQSEEGKSDVIPGIPEGGSRPESTGQQREKGSPSDTLSGQTGKGQQHQSEQQGKKQSKGPSLKVPNPAMLIWYFFNAWRGVSIDYRLTDNFSHYNIDGIPTLKHMLGFSRDTGVGTDTTHRKLARLPAIKNGKIITGSLDFDIIQNLSSSFKYNYAKDINENNQQKTEAVASTYFFLGDDPEANKKSWNSFIPDWQFRLTGLEKISIFRKVARSVQVEHARSGKFNENDKYDEGGKTRTGWSYSNNYSPLLGITINTVWGITGTIRYTSSTTFNYSASGGDSKSLRSGLDVTFSFSKSGGFRIPLPFLRKKKLNNEMQFNLGVSSSNDVSYARRLGSNSSEFVEQDKNSALKFKPSVTYRFSQKVNGSMFFEYSASENKRTGKYSYFEFGVNVNIAIR